MTQGRQRLPKNAAKVEFIAHLETIKSLLDEGYNLRNIHNKLCERHNLAMSYFALCAWYRKIIKEESGKKEESSKKQEKTKPVLKMPAIPSAPKKLTRPEDVDRGTLF